MFPSLRTVALVLAVAAMACGKQQQAQPEPGSEVRQEAHESGETWRASTKLRDNSRSRVTWVTIDEEVRLDSTGRLLYAQTHSRDDVGTPEVRVTFDASAHNVVVERGGRRVEWKVPGEQPWILAPVRSPAGDPIVTPLVAWTTYRATHNSEWVRLIRPLDQQTHVVPRDQYVVGSTVLVGDQAVEVDERFVRTITFGGASFPRANHQGAFRFRAGGIEST